MQDREISPNLKDYSLYDEALKHFLELLVWEKVFLSKDEISNSLKPQGPNICECPKKL